MKRHIVFVPGYYGSRLRDRVSNVLFWLSTFTLQKPEHTLAGIALPASDGRVVVDGIVDNVSILPILRVPIYHGFIAFLEHGMGYARNEIHAIGVDWRRSLTVLVADLKAAIDDAVAQSGGEPVDLIAHSHGGLVARAYLDKHGGANVAKLLTLGVPHTGMLETFKAVCEGISFLRFDPAQLMEVARGFPSAYELLPTDPTNGYFRWNNTAASPFVVNDWCATPAMKAMLADAAGVAPALSRNVPVPLFAIHGTHGQTLVSAEGPTNGATGVTFDTREEGDGTVPLASGAAQGITATGGVKRFAVPFGGHAFIFDDRNTQEVIRHILRDDPPPAAYFVASWEEQLYLPHSTNRVVVVLDDFDGVAIPNASVTLTLPGMGVTNQPIPQQPNGDYLLTVQMPGPGTHVPYVITASAPSLTQPFKATGLLVASSN
jgi:pimeloyl-ACP methyl ester carboxylesterase